MKLVTRLHTLSLLLLLAVGLGHTQAAEALRILTWPGYADPDIVKAFDAWQPVYANCLRLEADFYHHPALDWAKRKWWMKYWKTTLLATTLSFLAAAAGRAFGAEIFEWIKGFFSG